MTLRKQLVLSLIGIVIGLLPISAAPLRIVIGEQGSIRPSYTIVVDDQVWTNNFAEIARQTGMDAFLIPRGSQPAKAEAAVLANSVVNKRLFHDFDDFVQQDLAKVASQAKVISVKRSSIKLPHKNLSRALDYQIRFVDELQRAIYLETGKAYISLVLSLTKPSIAWDRAFDRLLANLDLD